jgi:hypothetical protein
MLEAIASARLSFKGPSYHDLREPLLKHIAEDIREYLHDLRREWSVCGCSIIADRLKDHGKGSIINFLVYCARGTVFLKSVDTSTENTDLLEIFDQVVREVGPENIVQFITDIDARYKAAVLDMIQVLDRIQVLQHSILITKTHSYMHNYSSHR